MSEGISEREARLRNRAWPALKYFLQSRTIEHLEAVEPAQLAQFYPPLPIDQLAQVLRVRIMNLRAYAKAGRTPPRLV